LLSNPIIEDVVAITAVQECGCGKDGCGKGGCC